MNQKTSLYFFVDACGKRTMNNFSKFIIVGSSGANFSDNLLYVQLFLILELDLKSPVLSA